MDQDKFALVEKILKDVENILAKNAELFSFDIVPVDTNFRNKSPVLHLENCLGLESWCIKQVYLYSYTELMDQYFPKPKKKSLKLSTFNSHRLSKLLNVTLLLNPELGTLWNKRRELVQKNLLEKSFELRFSKLVLSRKPKCNDAFSYRRYLIELILQDENLQADYIEALVNEELSICMSTSEKSPNNYHSWNHRMWLLRTLKTIDKLNLVTLHIKEYDFSQQWSSKHISDYSCFHYRQFCIENIFTIDAKESWKTFESTANVDLRRSFVRVLAKNFLVDTTIQASEENLVSYSDNDLIALLLGETFNNCRCLRDDFLVCRQLEVLFYELVLDNELIRFYKQHETLWYHRRFVIHTLLRIMYDYFGLVRQNCVLVKKCCKKCHPEDLRGQKAKIVRYDSNRVYSSVLFKVITTHELNFTRERALEGDNYSDRHEKYLRFVEGLNNTL